MARYFIGLFFILLIAVAGASQDKISIYSPEADAKTEIAEAVARAKAEHKHVLLQIGGNWCKWCIYFNNLCTNDTGIHEFLSANYEIVHVNYSKENYNPDVMASLEYPQRFGFPVFVILDGEGRRLHTQNSAYLEEEQGHSKKKVLEFLEHWSPNAFNPEQYR